MNSELLDVRKVLNFTETLNKSGAATACLRSVTPGIRTHRSPSTKQVSGGRRLLNN